MLRVVKYGIIGIVLVSFLFFGIYGVITGQKAYVAMVDGEKISTIKFSSYLSERKQNILSQKNDKQTIEFLASSQFERVILNEMINVSIIHKFLKDSGVIIDEKVVSYYVRTLQSFSKEGKFDNDYFQKYLKYTNTNERDFLKSKIPQLEEAVFSYMASAAKINAKNVAVEYVKSQKRQRNIDILMLNPNVQVQYSQDELADYYNTISQQFIQPAKHIATISYLDDYINQNIKIFHSTPQNIARYYSEEYMGKIIKLQYAIFNDKQTAEKVHAIVKKQGIALQNVTDTLLASQNNYIVKHGVETSNSIDNSTIIESIKKLPKGGVTGIIPMGNNFYIGQILEIKETKFADIRDKENLDKELLQKRKCNNAQIYSERISQDLQSGLSFESVSLKYGFPISSQVIVDEKTLEVVDASTNLKTKINALLLEHIVQNKDISYGHVVSLNNEKCSFAIYKQMKIEPERVQSLDEVRGKVITLLQNKKRLEITQKNAQTIASNVKSLKNSLSAYDSSGLFKNITVEVNNNISPDIFINKIGTTFATNGKDGKMYVITIKSEIPYGEKLEDAAIKNAETEISNAYYNSFLQEWLNLMHKQYNVRVNYRDKA